MDSKISQVPIAESFRSEEARLRRLTVWLTLLPIAAGACIIAISVWAVRSTRAELSRAQDGLIILSSEFEKKQTELQATRTSLSDAREAAEDIRHGINHYQRGEYSAAINDYRTAIQIDPGNYVVYDWLGYAYYRNKQYAEAESSLRKSVQLNSSYARGFYNLSLVLWARGEHNKAVDTIAHAIKLDPGLRQAVLDDGQFAPFGHSQSFQRLIEKASAH